MPTLSDLGLDARAMDWLDTTTRIEPSGLELPAGERLTDLLGELGLDDQDIADVPHLLDEALATPDLRWIAERYATVLRERLGRLGTPSPFGDSTKAWPTLGLDRGAAGRCVYVAALLSVHDDLRKLHAARGIPADVSAATCADLGRQMSVHRRTWGAAGLDTQLWMMLVWSGELVDLGRLQGEWLDPSTVGLHIPESGPLTPAAVDDSLRRLREGWPAWFGSRPVEAKCHTWLLDPRLAEALPDSNIAAFARRFALDDTSVVDDTGVLYFVFRRRNVAVPEGLSELPRRSALERVIIDHLESGGHWTTRTGRLRL